MHQFMNKPRVAISTGVALTDPLTRTNARTAATREDCDNTRERPARIA